MGDSLSDTEEIDKEDPTQAVPCAGGPDVGGRAAEREGLGDLLVPACLGVVMAGLSGPARPTGWWSLWRPFINAALHTWP